MGAFGTIIVFYHYLYRYLQQKTELRTFPQFIKTKNKDS